MKRKDLFLLTFLLSQVMPLTAMDSERQETPRSNATLLQKRLKDTRADLEPMVILHHNALQVLVVGQTRAGKSTAIKCLLGTPLLARKQYKLDAETADSGPIIGHRLTSETRFPSPWIAANGMIFWDFPGFGDTSGPEEDIVHHAMLTTVLKGSRFKLLLAVPEQQLIGEVTEFLDVLNHLLNIFPLEKLKNSLALLITKQGMTRGVNPYEALDEMRTLRQEDHYLLTPEMQSLLTHLLDHPERIPFFPAPEQQQGIYNGAKTREDIFKALDSLTPMESPVLKLQHLPPGARNLVTELAGVLNLEIDDILKLGLGLRIIELCKAQIEAYGSEGNLAKLQENLGAIKMAHDLLKNVSEEIVTFTQPFDRFFAPDPNTLTESAKTLTFLKTLAEEVTYARDTWTIALQERIEEIHQLLGKQVNVVNQIIGNFIDKVVKAVNQNCMNIMDSNEEEKDITDLTAQLTLIQKALAGLTNPETSADSLRELEQGFFGTNKDSVKEPTRTIFFFRSLHPRIQDPRPSWVEALEAPRDSLRRFIGEKEKKLNFKKQLAAEEKRREEEAKAREQERLAQEEAARREREEQHRAYLADLARLAADVQQQREEAERIEAARLEAARQEAERQRLEREAADRTAEEDRQTLLAALEAQRQDAERQRLAAEEQRRLQAEEAARVEAARQAQMAELARQQEKATRRIVEEMQRQQQETARLEAERRIQAEKEAAVHQAELARMAKQLQDQEEKRLADQRVAEAENERLRKEQVEKDRKADEDRKAYLAELDRQKNERDRLDAELREYQKKIKDATDREAEETKRKAAENKRRGELLQLPRRSIISEADYNLLPEKRRSKRVPKKGPNQGKTIYRKM